MPKRIRKGFNQGKHTEAGLAFVDLVFELFRTYGRLNSAGDDIAKGFGLSSARWRVLGSACESSKSVSSIARERGLTRQAVQEIVNSLMREGLAKLVDNPNHKSSKLVAPTRAGDDAIRKLNQKAAGWMNHVGDAASPSDIRVTIQTLQKVRGRLEERPVRNDKNNAK